MNTPPRPDLDFCSRCKEHAEFYLTESYWLSDCCSAPAVNVDVEEVER